MFGQLSTSYGIVQPTDNNLYDLSKKGQEPSTQFDYWLFVSCYLISLESGIVTYYTTILFSVCKQYISFIILCYNITAAL